MGTLSIMTSNSPTTVAASPRVHQLLQRLHTLSEAQEKSFSQMFFYGSRLVRFLMFGEIWSPKAEAHMKDKFVALDADKCRFIYLLARSLGACNVVEAGTSFWGLDDIFGIGCGSECVFREGFSWSYHNRREGDCYRKGTRQGSQSKGILEGGRR